MRLADAVVRSQIASDQTKTDLVRIEELAKEGTASAVQLDQATVDAHMRDAELPFSSVLFSEAS